MTPDEMRDNAALMHAGVEYPADPLMRGESIRHFRAGWAAALRSVQPKPLTELQKVIDGLYAQVENEWNRESRPRMVEEWSEIIRELEAALAATPAPEPAETPFGDGSTAAAFDAAGAET